MARLYDTDRELVEAMARALVVARGRNPDEQLGTGDHITTRWFNYIPEAEAHLAMDRVLRGMGDRLTYERLQKTKEN